MMATSSSRARPSSGLAKKGKPRPSMKPYASSGRPPETKTIRRFELRPRRGRSKVEGDAVEVWHPAIADHDVEALPRNDAFEGKQRRAADLNAQPASSQQASVCSRHREFVV